MVEEILEIFLPVNLNAKYEYLHQPSTMGFKALNLGAYLRRQTSALSTDNYLTFGVQGRPFDGAGVLGRGGVGGKSSSDPAFIISNSAEISSSPFPLSNGSDMSYIPWCKQIPTIIHYNFNTQY